ncbi:MAG: ABC transporter permease [Saprospiraceae bacterium]|nr:ABC transporter permease [Saprospiraceae bacterium]
MFFQKKANSLAEQASLAQTPWAQVWRRFRKGRMARWSWRVLLGLGIVALLADFIANEKPLYCKLGGNTYFPVFKQYAVDLGLAKWDTIFLQKSWDEHAYEAAIFPPIPYSATTLDLKNTRCRSPFGSQSVKSLRWRHWLGTDQLGRDVAAGMVAGTRVALLVGIISMGIATLLGILLGSLAGFFGDDRMRASWTGIVLMLLALFFAWFYGFSARGFALSEAAKNGGLGLELLKSSFIAAAIFALAIGLNFLLKKWAKPRRLTLPLDLIIMRAVEVMNAVPGLLLLLAMVAVLEKSSIFYVMAIIGLLRWTPVTRFLRAELLRIRNLNYIEAARAMAFPEWRILWRHALPNAIGPMLIVVAFGAASAILMESTLSFLGIGIGSGGVTWGSMLSEVRSNPSAWWLAVFPGLAIFLSVTIFNLIGDGLSEAMAER